MKRWIPFRYYNNNITVKLLSNSLKRCLVNDKCTYLDISKYNNWLCLHLGGPVKNMNETWMIMEINLTLLIAFNLTPDNESWILFEYWALNFNWSEMEYNTQFWWIFFGWFHSNDIFWMNIPILSYYLTTTNIWKVIILIINIQNNMNYKILWNFDQRYTLIRNFIFSAHEKFLFAWCQRTFILTVSVWFQSLWTWFQQGA